MEPVSEEPNVLTIRFPTVTAPAPAPSSLQTPVDAESALVALVTRIQRALGTKPQEAVRTAFHAADTNGSRKLSRAELGDACFRLGYGLLDSELDLLFRCERMLVLLSQ